MNVNVKSLSCVRLFATPWTVAYQAPLCMGFSRQEYWSGLPFPSPRDLPATNSYQSQNKCLKKGKKCYSNIQNEKKILQNSVYFNLGLQRQNFISCHKLDVLQMSKQIRNATDSNKREFFCFFSFWIHSKQCCPIHCPNTPI